MGKKISKKKYLEMVDASAYHNVNGKCEDEEFLKKVHQAVISNYGNLAGAARDLKIDTIAFYMMMHLHPDFNDFVRELQKYGKELKKDYYEMKLIDKIGEGSERCIIFANKTINKDMGYCEKKEIDMKGDVDIDVKWDD